MTSSTLSAKVHFFVALIEPTDAEAVFDDRIGARRFDGPDESDRGIVCILAGNLMKDHSLHFRQLAESLLPNDSRVLTPAGAPDVIILCTWRLIGDTHRPTKRSRMIRIVIAEEALEDYARGNDGARLAGDARFLEWLRRQLGSFDPNHDSPLGVDPPPVTWPLSTLELNG